MAGNVVEIALVTKYDGEGMDEARASGEEAGAAAEDAAAGQDKLSASADRAADALKEEGGAAGESADALKEEGGAAGESADALKEEGGSATDAAAGLNEVTAAAGRSADAQKESAGAADLAAASVAKSADAQGESAAKTDLASEAAGKGGKALRDLALGAGIVAAGAIDMGVKFAEGATQLVTGAGQSAAGLHQVEVGMLAISTATGTSAKDVEAGMYLIESAGYHGAAGLAVLKASAEGAKVGNAQLADVANVVTSALNAYHLPASQAVAITNELVATVASGKMHMQDLATSIANVLPVAASAHISFAQVGGALATMTMQGMDARRASMNLANFIRGIISPSASAASEMKALGLNANTLSASIGKVGLTGVLQEMTDAILKNTHGGDVLLGYMKEMSPAAQGLAREILAGKISTNDLATAVKGLNPEQAELIAKFKTSATSATGLKQTYDGAMKSMTGGATGLNVALLLGGKHMGTFKGNVDSVADAAKHAGPDVAHWGDVTADTAFKLDKAKTSAENLGISVGMALLPAMNAILGPVESFVGWLGQSKVAVDILAGVITGALAGYAVVKSVEAFNKLSDTWGQLSGGAKKLATSLGLIGTAEDEEAVATEGATEAQEGLNLAFLASPVGLIVAGIALLVVAFLELWKHCAAFRDFWKDAWKDVEHIVAGAVDFIRDHWKLIVAFILGPLGLVIDALVTHWEAVKHGFEDCWRFVVGVIRDATHVIEDIIRPWIDLTKIELSWFEKLGGLFLGWWEDAARAVYDVTGKLLGFVREIPAHINSALGGLPGMLFNAGVHAMEALIHGFTSMIGSLGSTIGGIASKVAGFFGLSPAKEGPLSGAGAPEIRGRHFTEAFAMGMLSGIPSLSGAAERVAAGVNPGGLMRVAAGNGAGVPVAGGGTSPVVIRIEGGPTEFDQFLLAWIRNNARVYGGGGPNSVQIAYGRTH